MNQVLVTGADGFIGSHLVQALLARGDKVRALVLYNPMNSWGWLEALSVQERNSVEVVLGDIRDGAAILKAMAGCHVVYHLAALISIQFSYECPELYLDVNARGTLNVLQAARALGVSRVVHTSSSEVYGSAQQVPITEEHRLNPQSPYAASKVAADQLALSYYRSFGVPVTVLRPFNTYGPRQSARAVIPTIIAQIASGTDSLRLGTVTPTRDFSYVEDSAAAFIAVAESHQTLGEVVQSGSEFEIAVGDLARLIMDVMGKNIPIECDEARVRPETSEVTRLFAATDKIRALTRWRPNYAGREGFERGLRKTIEWFSNPDNLRFYRSDAYHI